MSRKTSLLQCVGAYFHVYNRGVARQNIFCTPHDYLYCESLMSESLCHEGIALHAYALMPNHFHMLVWQDAPYSISRFLKRVCEYYARSWNRHHRRNGHLFQNRFRIRHVDNEAYLIHLSRYIHLNPVQRGLVKNPEDWKFSSCADYRKRISGRFVTTAEIVSLAGGAQRYWRFLHEENPACGEEVERYLIDHEFM